MFWLICCLLAFPSFVCAQSSITGKVKDSLNNNISYASIILKNSTDNIIAYTFSNENGVYLLKSIQPDNYILQVSSMGFKDISVNIGVPQKKVKIIRNFNLKSAVNNLDEIIIKTEKPIRFNKDTITFKAKAFSDGTEETVEELLKKIPGLQIDSEGAIKMGNQEIEKLMIDGDDFFQKGYKILSKNMPSYPIDEIEILKRYSNNRLLKGIEESNKVALNLKLSEKAKRIWFGNFNIGAGNEKFYQLKSNLMNFGTKNKYYFLTNLNNIGFDATGDINQLIYSRRTNEPGVIGDNQTADKLMNLSVGAPGFKRDRYNFNNAELLSLNAIINPTEKLKIKALGFFNWDENDFFRNTTSITNANGTLFTNTENYRLRKKSTIGFGKLEMTYNISKSQMIESTTKYNNAYYNDGSNLIFNDVSTLENLTHHNNLFDQNLIYTNKFNDKDVLLVSMRVIDEDAPQNYQINQFFLDELFPNLNQTNRVQQTGVNNMFYAGVNAHLLTRNKKEDLFEIQIGNEYRKDRLISELILINDETELLKPEGFQNNLSYKSNELYLKTKFQKNIDDFKIIVRTDLHQLFNRLENTSYIKSQSPFFITNNLGLVWQINNTNKISSNYIYNTSNAKILDVFNNFVLTGFRSFNRGTGNFSQLENNTYNIRYELGDWSNRFLNAFDFSYTKNNDFFSYNSIVQQNFTLNEKILIQGSETYRISNTAEYYFKKISSNLKLKLNYNQSNFKNIINNSNFRIITQKNSSYGLEMRSGFLGIFNYFIGTRWDYVRINSSTNNTFINNLSFLDLIFKFNKKFNIKLQTERYYFGDLESDKSFYFLDFEINKTIIENKLNVSLSGKNIFNTKRFRNISITDISTSTIEYRLLPRFLLLQIKYRF